LQEVPDDNFNDIEIASIVTAVCRRSVRVESRPHDSRMDKCIRWVVGQDLRQSSCDGVFRWVSLSFFSSASETPLRGRRRCRQILCRFRTVSTRRNQHWSDYPLRRNPPIPFLHSSTSRSRRPFDPSRRHLFSRTLVESRRLQLDNLGFTSWITLVNDLATKRDQSFTKIVCRFQFTGIAGVTDCRECCRVARSVLFR